IYAEAFLQNVAYRHAAKRLRMPSAQGLIVRLPKLVTDPTWEVMPVPTMLSIEDFLAAMRLWRWLRRMEGKPTGHSDGGAGGYRPAAYRAQRRCRVRPSLMSSIRRLNLASHVFSLSFCRAIEPRRSTWRSRRSRLASSPTGSSEVNSRGKSISTVTGAKCDGVTERRMKARRLISARS